LYPYCFFFSCLPCSPPFPPFPYTTLFRSMQSSADGPAVFYAGLGLLRDSGAKATPEEMRKWVGMLLDAARLYGPRYEVEMNTQLDRKSTRLNSSHQIISYAVFCLKKKNKN